MHRFMRRANHRTNGGSAERSKRAPCDERRIRWLTPCYGAAAHGAFRSDPAPLRDPSFVVAAFWGATASVHQPVEEMGRVMADLLLARIAGEPVPRTTVLPTRLVVRASA